MKYPHISDTVGDTLRLAMSRRLPNLKIFYALWLPWLIVAEIFLSDSFRITVQDPPSIRPVEVRKEIFLASRNWQTVQDLEHMPKSSLKTKSNKISILTNTEIGCEETGEEGCKALRREP